LSIPLSFKSEEQKIITELRRKNLQVYFKITYFDFKTGDIEYNFANLDPLEEIPREAEEILKKSLAKWREKYLKRSKKRNRKKGIMRVISTALGFESQRLQLAS
jgi:hypothetical protein